MSWKHVFHPDFAPHPVWWETAPPRAEVSTELPPRTDVLVVGGGYAGLNAALELARSGREAWVLEAKAFGHGASAANAGAVVAQVDHGAGICDPPDPSAVDPRLLLESASCLEHVERLLEREAIECGYERSGRFVAASSRADFDALPSRVAALAPAHAEAEIVEPDRQWEELGSDFYHGGLLIRRSGKLHPSQFHQGLVDACRRRGAGLTAHTPVTGLSGAPGDWTVSTERGTVRAGQVIIATNGDSGQLVPALRPRLIPVPSSMIATEEIPTGLAQSLVPNGRTVSETARLAHYYRLAPRESDAGLRMLFGGSVHLGRVDTRGPGQASEHASAKASSQTLYERMVLRFPQIRGIRVTHGWSGLVACTADGLPHLGNHNGLYFCVGCNGTGVGMLSFLGYLVARRLTGREDEAPAYWHQRMKPFPIPGFRANPWFLPAMETYCRAKNWLRQRAR